MPDASLDPKERFSSRVDDYVRYRPGYPAALEWKVSDPIGGSAEVYRATRDHIEQLVMKLIVELRRKNK